MCETAGRREQHSNTWVLSEVTTYDWKHCFSRLSRNISQPKQLLIEDSRKSMCEIALDSRPRRVGAVISHLCCVPIAVGNELTCMVFFLVAASEPCMPDSAYMRQRNTDRLVCGRNYFRHVVTHAGNDKRHALSLWCATWNVKDQGNCMGLTLRWFTVA